MNKEDYFPPKGCLNPEKHNTLVANIEKYAEISGLGGGNKHFIWESIAKYNLNKLEMTVLENLKRMPSSGKKGVLYIGQPPSQITEKFMALTGCMVRNFVDARCMTLEKVLYEYKENKEIEASVVCIPNLCTDATDLPKWQQGLLSDFLIQHQHSGKLLFGYIQNASKMGLCFPSSVCDHLKNNFITTGD
jgi:hypothetical protein